MKQLELPFKDSHRMLAERVFKKMLEITPENPRGYEVEHMTRWLHDHPDQELFSISTGGILSRWKKEKF